MAVRGIRGATSVEVDSAVEILAATRELLTEILRVNALTHFDDIASIYFTTTPDLTATFPAEAARELGIPQVQRVKRASPGLAQVPVAGRRRRLRIRRLDAG